uniref:SSUH2 protein n=1 Tax=Denticeps clupeoides TaxID=299321 RepID=A0AAY4B3E7_9TELE
SHRIYHTAAPFLAPSNPAAPPVSGNFPGYEGFLGGGEGGFIPSPPLVLPTPPPGTAPPEWNLTCVCEEEARQAFLQYVSEHCCYGSGPAENGVITSREPFNTFRYSLQTFTESRKLEPKIEPYQGQPLDAGSQPVPPPWAIWVQAPPNFTELEKDVPVPFTSSIKDCVTCKKTGKCKCSACSGKGNQPCSDCRSTGSKAGVQCDKCNGSGRKCCSSCSGKGFKVCATCKGEKRLLEYLSLKVKWINDQEEFVTEKWSGLTKVKLRDVTGKKLFEDTQCLVYPVQNFPDVELCQASQKMVTEHQNKHSQTERILQQKQTIELIPVTKVTYQWEQKSYVFFVYGMESKVATDDYPDSCCLCTLI